MLLPNLRLNEIVNNRIHYKKIGLMHSLCNSLKRNTITENSIEDKAQQQYQSKIPSVNFGGKDLNRLLKYILQKDFLSPSDRNLIRRILLHSFDQNLICAGGKKYIDFLKHHQYKRNQEKICLVQKQFYFLLKGNVKVYSSNLTYDVSQGQVFGHIEILSNQQIQCLSFESDSTILCLSEHHFNMFFKANFQKSYKQKEEFLGNLKCQILSKVSLMNKYFFLENIKKIGIRAGAKIVKKDDPLINLYFIGSLKITQTQYKEASYYKCIGLHELLKKSNTIIETVYSMEIDAVDIYYIERADFIRYIPQNIIDNFESISLKSLTSLKSSCIKQNPEQTPRSSNFLRIKKVKLSCHGRKFITEQSQQYTTSFKFIKSEDLYCLKTSNKNFSTTKSRLKYQSEK